jgi:nitrous oxide reductase accessory protein NosL
VTRRLCIAVLALLGLAACSPTRDTGPAEIVWDRDTCERCLMAISEPRFAAQVRDHDHRVHRFDDLGCALLWIDEQAAAPRPAEIWVANPAADGWLDARSTAYRAGPRTPMGYGLVPAPAGVDGIGLEEAWQKIRKLEDERRSHSR